MKENLPPVLTYYKSNIPTDIVSSQARVFEHLGIELVQCLEDSMTHPQWLNRVFSQDQDLTIVCDIDAFPLNRQAFVDFAEQARKGAVVGLEQVANHLGKGDPYAGPMFLACTKHTYAVAGRPSLSNTPDMDVAQSLTYAAQNAGISVEMIPPQFAIQPRWPLGDRGVFGTGTFYGKLDFFHLFTSRFANAVELFTEVADCTVKGRHDFGKYLEVLGRQERKKRRFLSLF